MTAVQERVLAATDDAYVVDLLQRLVRFQSVNIHLDPAGSCVDIADAVERELRGYGLPVERDDSGIDQGWGPNVVATLGSGKPPILILTTHMDVVPPYDLSRWNYPPFSGEVVDGIMYGRGTTDAKGSLAAMMAGIRALARSGIALQGTVKLVAWTGDEAHPATMAYFSGITYLVRTDRLKGDALIWGEPYDLRVVRGSRGRVWLRYVVGGEASHSASGAGVNAIRSAARLIDAIYQVPRLTHPLLGTDTINVGTIKGGVQTNMVPDSCAVTFDIRFAPPRSVSDVLAQAQERVDDLAGRMPEFRLQAFEVPERKEPVEYPEGLPVYKAAIAAGIPALGRPLEYGGAVSFGDTSEWREQAGLREICFFGPGKTEMAHAINERVAVADLVAAARIYALTAAAYCGATAGALR
jgi:acetylornithine deacetylase/succinyl-diaminopimelate desuccinylase-like protein